MKHSKSNNYNEDLLNIIAKTNTTTNKSNKLRTKSKEKETLNQNNKINQPNIINRGKFKKVNSLAERDFGNLLYNNNNSNINKNINNEDLKVILLLTYILTI